MAVVFAVMFLRFLIIFFKLIFIILKFYGLGAFALVSFLKVKKERKEKIILTLFCLYLAKQDKTGKLVCSQLLLVVNWDKFHKVISKWSMDAARASCSTQQRGSCIKPLIVGIKV